MHRGSALPQVMDDLDVRTHLDDGGGAHVDHAPNRPTVDLSRMSGNLAFHTVVTQLRNVDICPACQKTRVVVNIGGYRRPIAERISAATHCACPSGPAYAGIGSDESVMTENTVVEFEGEQVRWGDLMVQDRKAYLAGGYAF